MELEHLLGVIAVSIQESSHSIIFMGKESTNGPIKGNTQVIGRTIKWKVMAFSHGRTEGNTKDNTLMTRSMGTENSFGLMEDSIRVSGRMVVNTERESIEEVMESREKVNGKTARKSDG